MVNSAYSIDNWDWLAFLIVLLLLFFYGLFFFLWSSSSSLWSKFAISYTSSKFALKLIEFFMFICFSYSIYSNASSYNFLYFYELSVWFLDFLSSRSIWFWDLIYFYFFCSCFSSSETCLRSFIFYYWCYYYNFFDDFSRFYTCFFSADFSP